MSIGSMNFFFVGRSDLTSILKSYADYWGQSNPTECDIIVALGGDGFMLRTCVEYQKFKKPFYGLRFGSVGHIMNNCTSIHDLHKCVEESSKSFCYSPIAVTMEDKTYSFLAFNDVSVYRKNYQALKLKIWIDDVLVCPLLTGDGIVCSSKLGESAYYASSGGEAFDAPYTWAIQGLNTSTLYPWKNVKLQASQTVRIQCLHQETRPAILGWDGQHCDIPTTSAFLTMHLRTNDSVRILRKINGVSQ